MKLFDSLKQIIQTYLPEEQIRTIERAFILARDAHQGQHRSSGEPYITHPVAVACIIAEMKLDYEAIMAALLHDVIEDTPYTETQLTEEFGKSVAEIVEGVSKLDKLKFRTRQEAQVANFQKMILAMTEDIRVVLIKLADRTHNMRTLGVLRPDKRRRIAKETMEIYAPLAHRLGIEHIKNELEDLSFKAMYPYRYEVLIKAMNTARNNHKDLIGKISQEIYEHLRAANISAQVTGRERPLYTVYQKLRQKEQEFHSIMDLYAFDVIVGNHDQCYIALGRLHALYKPRPQMVKDYIAVPKANGYQSLQTQMIGPKGVPVEVHIATEEMQQMAEMGVTAKWSHKERGKNDSTAPQIRAQRWLESLIELQQSVGNSFEFIESVKSEFFPKEIYVFTPKGRIIELPKGATPIDFAYAVHSDVGSGCVGAKVDRKPYPLSQPLVSGQTIEIITAEGTQPSSNWLNFVVTAKARTKIRQSLKNLEADTALLLGKNQLVNVLQPVKLTDISEKNLQQVLEIYGLKTFDDLCIQIGLGNLMSAVVAYRLLDESVEIDTDGDPFNNDRPLKIKGSENLLTNFAQCCHPIPGDPIVAYVTPGKGLVVHHARCANVRHKKSMYYIAVEWENADTKTPFEAELRIKMLNCAETLSNLMSALAVLESNIRSIWTEEQNGQLYDIVILLNARNTHHLATIIESIKTLPGFVHIDRNINA